MCFAVPILSQFSALDVEEISPHTQHPEVSDPIDLTPFPQLQQFNRRKN